MVNFTGHFKVEHDPWLYKQEKKKFVDSEAHKKLNEEEGKKHPIHVEDAHKTEKKHVVALAPHCYDKKFLTYELDADNKFANDDSVKFKYGSSNVAEANFVMKNLVDKNALPEDVSSNLKFF